MDNLVLSMKAKQYIYAVVSGNCKTTFPVPRNVNEDI